MFRKDICFMFFSAMLVIANTAGAGNLAIEFPENFAWNGLNPFSQPAHTLNFYGSGDVDNNCRIDQGDIDSLEELVAGNAVSNHRADVNGDGKLTSEDVTVLRAYLDSDSVLPAHWNTLTKEQRIRWLNRCLALDVTSSIPASADNFVCLNFSTQFYCNFSYYGGNLAHTIYTGGGTIYNIPVYMVIISGHALNAVLIGDDPLEFNDWYFIEPQNFKFVDPVDSGEGMSLEVPTFITTGTYSNKIIEATRTMEGWTITKTTAGLITQRPQAQAATSYIDMIPSWNPIVVTTDNSAPIILYEKLDQRLPPGTSIFIASIVNNTIVDEAPLVFDTLAARLFDVQKSPSGKLYLLWRGTRNFRPALFTGTIDLQNKRMKDITGFTGSQLAKAGGLTAISDESLHVVWLTDRIENNDSTLSLGINQSTVFQDKWSAPQNVAAFSSYYYSASWSQHISVNYTMDMVNMKGNPVVLTVPQSLQSAASNISLHFTGDQKQSDSILENDSLVSGARMAIDNENTIHCVYWATHNDSIKHPTDKILYRSFSNNRWSEPFILDSSTVNRCTDITVNKRNDILAVWEKKTTGNKSVFCTRVKSNGFWQPAEIYYPTDDQEVWYPRIAALQDTNYIVTWESRGKYRTEVRFRYFSYSPESNIAKVKNDPQSAFKKMHARLQQNKLIVKVNYPVPVAGSIVILNMLGKTVCKSDIDDLRCGIIELPVIKHGFFVVKVTSGDDIFIQKINKF